MKKNLLVLFFIFSLVQASAENLQAKFAIIGVRCEQAESNIKMNRITVFLNDTIEFGSLSGANIFVNDRPLKFSKITYSKRGQSFIFFVPDDGKEFSLRFENIKNASGQTIRQTRISSFGPGTFWKYSKELNKWQKF